MSCSELEHRYRADAIPVKVALRAYALYYLPAFDKARTTSPQTVILRTSQKSYAMLGLLRAKETWL